MNFITGPVTFILNVLSSGEFALKESDEIVASGQIKASFVSDKELLDLASPKTKKDEFLPLESSDIYKELRLKGYDYKDSFRGIKLIDNTGKRINCNHMFLHYTIFLVNICYIKWISLI